MMGENRTACSMQGQYRAHAAIRMGLARRWILAAACLCAPAWVYAQSTAAAQTPAQAAAQVRLRQLLEMPAPVLPAPPAGAGMPMPLWPGGAGAVAASPGGERLVVLSTSSMQVLDALTGKAIHRVQLARLFDRHLSVFPGGRVAVSSESGEPGLRFWDLEAGALLRTFPRATGPHRILPGGQLLAYAEGAHLLIYDPLSDRTVSAPALHHGFPFSIAVAPDGRHIATLSSGTPTTGAGFGMTLTLWRLLPGPAAGEFRFERVAAMSKATTAPLPQAVVFDAAGKSIWLASDVELTRWQVGGRPEEGQTMVQSESVATGSIRGGSLLRLPGSDILIVAGSHPRRGAYLLFYDTLKKRAALVDSGIGPIPMPALSADGRVLYSATHDAVRRRELPAAAAYADAREVLAALQPSPVLATSDTPGTASPLRRLLPADARVEVVGVHEGGGDEKRMVQTVNGGREARAVSVTVAATARPLVLVLTSSAPVLWNLQLAPDARVAHVLLAGEYESVVNGAGQVPVTRIAHGYAYRQDDPQQARDYALLERNVRFHTGKAPDGFQGESRGVSFNIVNTPTPVATPSVAMPSINDGVRTDAAGSGPPREAAATGVRPDPPPAVAEQVPDGLSPGPGDRLISAAPSPAAAARTPPASTPASTPAFTPMPGESRQRAAAREAFAETLYAVSAYTGEETSLDRLVDAELELVASRWLARKLRSAGAAPAHAPARWEGMLRELRVALAPLARAALAERAQALQAAGLAGKQPYLRQYHRLLLSPPETGEMLEPRLQARVRPTDQTADMPDVLAFHRAPAAVKWRALWPELRAYAARMAALHYQAGADPALAAPGRDWNARALALVRPGGGKLLSSSEWDTMREARFGFTLSGLDRFLLPLGTATGGSGAGEHATTVAAQGSGVVITQREGAGLQLRFLHGRWERELTGRLSRAEMAQIDEALIASYDERKGYWFAALGLEWDAHLAVARQLRDAPQMQAVYRSFASRSEQTMLQVWARWASPK